MSKVLPEKTASNHVALIRVSNILLAQVLELPGETRILQAYSDRETLDVYFIVESPDLPAVPEGTRPPLASPLIKQEFSWGLPDGSQ